MACFLVPATEAIITTVARKAIEKKELANGADAAETKLPFSHKLKWLNNMLWGGSALLAFEHIWHGEVSPIFPFLTATRTVEGTAEMLHEMATSGVLMAVLVTAVWLGMVAVSSIMERHEARLQLEANAK
ncbi:MAG: hypothetical protein IJL71_02505 [Oscillospiraceae bacterium]|nr:hypothetical protein [Oscillospiraceae bacterium]